MSKQLTDAGFDRFKLLMMKTLDGEATRAEQSEFELFVQEYPECRREWNQFKQLKEVTGSMKFKSPPAEVWDTYWRNVYNRLERGIAWILFSVGIAILLTYAGFKAIEAIISDPTMVGLVKAGVLLTIGGAVLLLVSVVRERFFTSKRDPYKEVIR